MTTFEIIGQIALAMAALTTGIILGGNLFDVIVSEHNLVRGFPDSIATVRKHYQYSNPGDFFKLFSPIYGLTVLLALLAFWDLDYGRRWLIVGSIVSYLITQAITVLYFFPQNRLLREGPIDEVARLFSEFSRTRTNLDILRNLLTLTAGVLLLVALSRPIA